MTNTFKPELGKTFYIPCPTCMDLYNELTWTDDQYCLVILERGMAFGTREEAMDAAEWMVDALQAFNMSNK